MDKLEENHAIFEQQQLKEMKEDAGVLMENLPAHRKLTNYEMNMCLNPPKSALQKQPSDKTKKL
jgi:hypothetical protein